MMIASDMVSAEDGSAEPYDLALIGGTVIDGTGLPAYRADVYVADGRVARIDHNAPPRPARETHRVDGHVVAPGFIDVHTHDDIALIADPAMRAKVSQGVTTVITGLCGYSAAPFAPGVEPPEEYGILLRGAQDRFESFASYLDAVAEARPAVNWLPLVGHSTLRLSAMDRLDRPASPPELDAMLADLERALDAGAAGISSGLAYAMARHASTEELIALCRAMSGRGGLYVTHLRDEADGLLDSVEEALRIGREAGVGVVFSHHKAIGAVNHGRTKDSLALIDRARQSQEVALDVYPYTYSSTSLTREKAARGGRVVVTRSGTHPEFAGVDLDVVAEHLGCSRDEAIARLQPAGALYHMMDEADVARVLAHDLTMIGSDGLPFDACPHPRLWGTFPRVLQRYVRQTGLLSLETAIHRMTGLPAQVFGLSDRGTLRPGHIADIVVFDPDSIADNADAQDPTKPATGIQNVLVRGQQASLGTGSALHSNRASECTP
ncbi:MAG: D-aminoacylase [Pseudomonadota bacterium]